MATRKIWIRALSNFGKMDPGRYPEMLHNTPPSSSGIALANQAQVSHFAVKAAYKLKKFIRL
jgi:hypothetical protein